MINLLSLASGAVLQLKDGNRAEVVENVGDGQWVSVRLHESSGGVSQDEELCHAQDIEKIISN